MRLAVHLVTLTVLLYLVQEGFRRAGRWVAWGVFLGLPLILTPYWLKSNLNQVGVFPWVKLYTILVSVSWLTALRFTSVGRWRWALDTTFLFLVFNILEAVTQDLFGGHLAHFLLASTGFLLILTLPAPIHAIRIAISSRHRDLHYEGTTRGWIVGYTLWNWAFLYLNLPAIAGHQLAVLGSAFVVGMLDPRRWLQARAYTLAADLLLLFTFPQFFLRLSDTSHWTTPYREDFAAGACLIIMTVYAVRFFLNRREARRGRRTRNHRPLSASSRAD